ncbi:hypothetical protein [Paraburkholderia fungorum]|uniref:hypothetical protein n=1 Tax=Paraburkholderia fungorum TaxID=134537 RepID=UPI0033141EA1
MKALSVLTFATAAALVLAGCSSRKDPTRSNFEAAIADGLKSGPNLCISIALDWPDTTADETEQARQRRALVAAGLLSSTPDNTADAIGRPISRHRYNLTLEGKKYADGGALCYGKAHLQKLLDWDPVATVFGVQQTMTRFTYSIDGLPDWAKGPDVQAALPNMKNAIDGQNKQTMSMPLVLDGDHWRADSPHS